jgi:hypothetical protein
VKNDHTQIKVSCEKSIFELLLPSIFPSKTSDLRLSHVMEGLPTLAFSKAFFAFFKAWLFPKPP